jgi:trans-aconitate methyltransferase
MNRAEHWNAVYTAKTDQQVSWFEPEPSVSLAMLDAAGVSPTHCIIDIGGGNSRLVDHLLARGVSCITVLDVSAEVIARTRERLGAAAAPVTWLVADVAGDWTPPTVDLWHDRAVFHFLVDAADRTRYVERLYAAVKPGGAAIIATFAQDGPEKCSGLPVVRYAADELAEAVGTGFSLEEARVHVHATPWGSAQPFQYTRFRRR